MCKLDNKIRTCLPALYKTYQRHNLIPASLFPVPQFAALLLLTIEFLLNEAASTGIVRVGLCIAVQKKKRQGMSHSSGTYRYKGPIVSKQGESQGPRNRWPREELWKRAQRHGERWSKQTALKWRLLFSAQVYSFRAGSLLSNPFHMQGSNDSELNIRG